MRSTKGLTYIIISACISYIYFMMESITNYNLGRDKQQFQWNLATLVRLFRIPPIMEMFKISLSVGSFAVLSSVTFIILDYIYFQLL